MSVGLPSLTSTFVAFILAVVAMWAPLLFAGKTTAAVGSWHELIPLVFYRTVTDVLPWAIAGAIAGGLPWGLVAPPPEDPEDNSSGVVGLIVALVDAFLSAVASSVCVLRGLSFGDRVQYMAATEATFFVLSSALCVALGRRDREDREEAGPIYELQAFFVATVAVLVVPVVWGVI
eukprot:CAMPEP_0119484974 /NCGR_PEP_ID=MMETSP1344-20130328/11824_1 /TAXON_ID=236787 /ORGANISM="Florenciella parvula, Strain CCMP2471" /LENGTH=175 /DNA_ID=CAMNT_0007519607 /DNA_START=141 /DNA_END=668 /DNA_ORIENTATION=-